MKVVIEVQDGELLCVRSDCRDVELLVVDRDFEGKSLDRKPCSIVAYGAEHNPAWVSRVE
jgi:hypothetical protein